MLRASIPVLHKCGEQMRKCQTVVGNLRVRSSFVCGGVVRVGSVRSSHRWVSVEESRHGLNEILMGMSELAVSARTGGESLVAVRPEVLSDAEHALGNLFQRLYHVTRVAREGLGPHADRLTDAVRDLEQLLELLFDYVSPVDMELRPVGCGRVAESFASHLRGERPTRVVPGPWAAERVMADPRILARSFQLLARALPNCRNEVPEVVVVVHHDAVAQRIGLRAALGADTQSRSPTAELAWEVAGRLVDLQGGDLQRVTENGAVTLTLHLPLLERERDAE